MIWELTPTLQFSILPAIIAGGTALLGGAMSLFGGKKTNDKNLQIARENNQAQMDLAKYQADQNLNLWNLNNEYNTPEAQMQRYKDAGLNPNLIYGSGSASAGNSSSPAKGYDAPTLQRAEVHNYMPQASQLLMNGLQQAMQIKKTQAEIDSIRQNTENLGVDNQLKRLNAIYFEMRNAKTEAEKDFWIPMFQAELAKVDSVGVLNWTNAQNVDTNRRLTEALKPYEIEFRKTQLFNAQETNNQLKFLNSLQPLKRQELISQIANLSVSTYGKELENKITSVLIDSGINLRGSALERAVAELLSTLGESFGNDDNWFGKFLNRFVK